MHVKELVPPKTNDLNSIRCTSGTTGTPKGVMITHKKLVSCISGVYTYIYNTGVKFCNTSELEMTKIQKSAIKSYLFKTAMKAKTKLHIPKQI